MLRFGYWLGVFFAFMAIVGVKAPPASAKPVQIEVQCGDTIGPGGSWELSADIGPCRPGTGRALTILGPARVDLGGHRIQCVHRGEEYCCNPGQTCAPPYSECTRGLALMGSDVRVANGTIEGCYDGVAVGGDGHHEVRGVETHALGEGNAFDVHSDRNLLEDNVAGTCDECLAFSVRGDRNRLRSNSATIADGLDHIAYGAEVRGHRNVLLSNRIRVYERAVRVEGNDNRIKRNAIQGGHGGLSVGGNRNRVGRNSVSAADGVALWLGGTDNVATGNRVLQGNEFCAVRLFGERSTLRRTAVMGELAFCIAGTGHRVDKNVAENTDSFGYWVQGVGHLLRRNRSIGRGVGSTGFLIEGQRHTLIGNEGVDHRVSGFHVTESDFGHLLKSNVAFGNNADGSPASFDVRDDNPGCGTNRWIRNEFGTRNQACIGGRAR